MIWLFRGAGYVTAVEREGENDGEIKRNWENKRWGEREGEGENDGDTGIMRVNVRQRMRGRDRWIGRVRQ